MPQRALADFYLHSWDNQHEGKGLLRLGVEAGYYLTHNNFDGRGSLLVPTNFDQYSRIQTDLLASWGFAPRVSAYVRLGWARAALTQTTQMSDAFGLSDSTLGVSARIMEPSSGQEGLTLDAQLQGDFPLYGMASGYQASTTTTTSTPTTSSGLPMGDGTIDITGGLFANLPITHLKTSTLNATLGAGFTYRTADFSSAIPWSLSASLKPRAEGFSAALKVLGLISMGSDPREQDVVPRTTTFSAASGGSFITGAVNPSLITVRGEAGYQFNEQLGVSAFFAQSVWGLASPNGMYFGAALTARLGIHPKGTDASLSAQDYGRSNQGFINYSLEAKVMRVNDRLNLIKLDKGSQDGIETDQIFDIFFVRKDGNVGDAVARGHITKTKANESALKIDEYFKEIWIDEGFLAKRPVQ